MANNNLNLIEKLLGGSGLNQVWVKVFSLVKILTGDVDVKNKGNLQKQIDDVRSDVEGIMDGTGDTGLVFADDTESEYDTAIGQVVSGKPLSVLFQYLKAALKSAYTLAQKAYNVAAGKNQARVFATVDALDEWLGDPDNLAQLHVGDNFYIVALDVPDYWWDGEQKQPLETQKVDMTTYDQAIAALQSADTKLNEDISNHKSSADHDGRYYTETEVNNLLSQKAASNHNHDSRYYTESEIDTKLNGKANINGGNTFGGNNIFNNQVTIKGEVGVTPGVFATAPLYLEANNVAGGARAQIGFHNKGVNAGVLYLDTDGRLRFQDNGGNSHTISWE